MPAMHHCAEGVPGVRLPKHGRRNTYAVHAALGGSPRVKARRRPVTFALLVGPHCVTPVPEDDRHAAAAPQTQHNHGGLQPLKRHAAAVGFCSGRRSRRCRSLCRRRRRLLHCCDSSRRGPRAERGSSMLERQPRRQSTQHLTRPSTGVRTVRPRRKARGQRCAGVAPLTSLPKCCHGAVKVDVIHPAVPCASQAALGRRLKQDTGCVGGALAGPDTLAPVVKTSVHPRRAADLRDRDSSAAPSPHGGTKQYSVCNHSQAMHRGVTGARDSGPRAQHTQQPPSHYHTVRVGADVNTALTHRVPAPQRYTQRLSRGAATDTLGECVRRKRRTAGHGRQARHGDVQAPAAQAGAQQAGACPSHDAQQARTGVLLACVGANGVLPRAPCCQQLPPGRPDDGAGQDLGLVRGGAPRKEARPLNSQSPCAGSARRKRGSFGEQQVLGERRVHAFSSHVAAPRVQRGRHGTPMASRRVCQHHSQRG